ncbi:MAG: hypothetical protein QW087_01325 [Methanomassiliicoccales archaeon]
MMENERVRWLLGNKPTLTTRGNVFGDVVTETRFNFILHNVAMTEIERNMILIELERGPKTVHELHEFTGIRKMDIVKHLMALMKWRKVEYAGRMGNSPLYAALTTPEKEE